MTDTDWLALADFLDAHANDMRSWTEDEPKFRATAEGLRQYAAITAERDQLRAERTQLTGDSMTDIKMTYAYEAGIEDGKSEAKAEVARLRAAIERHRNERPIGDHPYAEAIHQADLDLWAAADWGDTDKEPTDD